MEKSKSLGQVFTPSWIVNIMLNNVGYTNKNVLKKKVIEPSFGHGVFLIEIIKRYIQQGKKAQWDIEAIKKGLQNNIYGIELDKELYESTIQSINKIVRYEGIKDVNWNFFNQDALLFNDWGKFDYVIGNPPYIKVHNICVEARDRIKKEFSLCTKGMIDIYISFFELGMKLLNKRGRMIYITPNSFMKNSSNQGFRDYITANRYLKSIIDFGSNKVFEGFSTYTCISLLEKGCSKDEFSYYQVKDKTIHKVNTMCNSDFIGKKLILGDKKLSKLLTDIRGKTPLSHYTTIQYGLCTQRDKIYICDQIKTIDKNYCFFNGYKIENAILKNIIKGSRMHDNKERKIIFPYIKKNKRWEVIQEKHFIKDFPFTYKYLCTHKEELQKRDMDKGVLWYEYGRSQAIQHLHKDKLIIDMIVNGKVNTRIVDKETMMYSGIAMMLKEKKRSLDLIQKHIKSDKFLDYSRFLGKDMQNDYKCITTNIVKNYGF